MSSLSFIPRNLAKNRNVRKQEPSSMAGTSQQLTEPPVSACPLVAVQPPAATQKATTYDDTDHANLIALSLSDYVLWLDSDLRQKLGVGAQQSSNEGGGYISLNYLFEHSVILASLFDAIPRKESHTTRSKVQSAVVKAIRAHASHLLDVRLLLHSDQAMPRFGKQKEVGGGYEVRRKRMGLVMRGKSEWDACTLYLENIPPGYRSYSEIIRFLNDLLHDAPPIPSASALPGDTLIRIQGITFPPHHSDNLNSRPSCKGFALVTFAHATDCEHLKNFWPWFRQPPEAEELTGLESGDEHAPSQAPRTPHIARQYNFRVITKKRWLELKVEYLAYRQRLVEEINTYQDARQSHRDTQRQEPHVPRISTGSNSHIVPVVQDPFVPSLDASSTYPPNCLVFVKNVHPETTKTTLRHLFSQAFQSQDVQPHRKDVEGLDYVDFSKGMTTCYLRLASPKHTTILISFFNRSDKRIAQVSGMDETGTDVSLAAATPGGANPITMDRVTGRPEEIYWEKVPVKVKKSAVEKAINLVAAEQGGDRDRPDTTTWGGIQKRSRGIDGVDMMDEPSSGKKRRKY